MKRAISVNNFNFVQVIGKGGFGKVWIVEKKKNRQLYALKVMQKPKYLLNHKNHFKEKCELGHE